MIEGALVWYAVSVIAQSLPEPRDDERWYGAVYRAANIIGANPPHVWRRTHGETKER